MNNLRAGTIFAKKFLYQYEERLLKNFRRNSFTIITKNKNKSSSFD